MSHLLYAFPTFLSNSSVHWSRNKWRWHPLQR